MIGWVIAGATILGLVLGRKKLDDKFTPGGLEDSTLPPEPFPEALGLSFSVNQPEGYLVAVAASLHDKGGRDYTLYELQKLSNPVTGLGDAADLEAQRLAWWVAKWRGRNAWIAFQANEVPITPQNAPGRDPVPKGETRAAYRQGAGSAAEVKTMRRDWQV